MLEIEKYPCYRLGMEWEKQGVLVMEYIRWNVYTRLRADGN